MRRCTDDDVELHVWVADGSAPGAERHLAGEFGVLDPDGNLIGRYGRRQ